ncbi:glycoside hydrolase family 26 protein [Arthrobacter celericrescens]|uniref:glycoside hydrolase family 26 protein n=1 Tax=Arthrobacter celericrescens TaxID=2320851 RepID=UPI000EA3E0EB|nr:glycosyl hydrolase [Arthrobacter celericrescens]
MFPDVSRPVTRRAALGVVGAVGLAAATAGHASAAAPQLAFGVATPGGPLDAAGLNEVTRLAGEAPRLILLYKDFQQQAPVAEVQACLNRGARPVITWEPWVTSGGLQQPGYSPARIAAGYFDSYLRSWATALAPFGNQVTIRFAHEMNGDWYPWCPGVNGTTAEDYIAAWRRVHTVFTVNGARPQWMWSVNDPYFGSVPLSSVYPGSDVVDQLALDSYNFGTSQGWSAWKTPSQVFAPGLDALRALGTGKRIIISETASSELGGSKPNWIRDAIPYLDAQPDVEAFIWFHLLKETDWRINSSKASAGSFKKALAARALP